MRGATAAGSRSRSTVPSSSDSGAKPSGTPRSAWWARPIAASGCTGPPTKMTGGSTASGAHAGSGVSTVMSGDGRFSTTPSAPSSVCSRISTTVRKKFGSARSGVATSSRPRSESLTEPTRRLVRWESEHADRVAAADLVDGLVVESREHLLRDLLGVGPGRVGVRVVGLERDVVDTDLVEGLEAVLVAKEAPEDLAVVVGRRGLGDAVTDATPGPMLLPHVVRTLEDVRDPADLTLGVREAQVRVPDQHTGEEEVAHRRHGVPERQGRLHRRRGVRRGGRHLGRRTDMHAHDGSGLGARGEERIPRPGVDAGQPEVRRDLTEAHRVDSPRRVASHFRGAGLDIPQGHNRQWDEPTVTVATPLLDHPVVVCEDARQREVLVLRFEEGLATEPGEGR